MTAKKVEMVLGSCREIDWKRREVDAHSSNGKNRSASGFKDFMVTSPCSPSEPGAVKGRQVSMGQKGTGVMCTKIRFYMKPGIISEDGLESSL